LFLAALLTGQWYAAILSFSCYGSYVVALMFIVLFLEQAVQLIRSHHQPSTQLSIATIFKMLMAIPLTQSVYGSAFLSSLWMSKVTWRGITYQFKGPWNIRLVEYRPYQSSDTSASKNISVH
jgi:hypothetical protein